jgi:tetratricopeptide (TPR) repeat protein
MSSTDKKVLAIQHAEGSVPATFALTRLSDGKSLAQVTIPSPYEFEVEGQPNSNLMRELRWYLEHFLDYPFHPETDHADRVLDALKSWGSQAFNALFDRSDGREWLSRSGILQIRSDDPQVLSWPWEALYDSRAGSYLGHRYRIERRLNQLEDAPDLGDLPTDRVNILMVVARPYENDVRYRSIARPLVELIRSRNLPAHVDILRPPTFDQLRAHLRAHPHFYHVIHFDGHGGYGNSDDRYGPHQYRAPQGCLVFEDDKGKEDAKSANDLSTLLHEHAVPAVVLNACQSATLDEKAEDAFATVATALLRSGMRSVVAMAYSLYVSGAKVFLPAFYGRLFETGSVAEAALAGRQQMLVDKKRISARGPFPLEDWLLPVLYQQAPLDLSYAGHAEGEAFESHLPEEVQQHREAYGFIGRDGPILEMERALQRETPCILIQGLGGVGKTTLARGFLRWLDETGGLDDALWFDFRDIRSAQHVINRTGEAFYGANFGVAANKLELIARALRKRRVVMVWDNFESAAQNLRGVDRDELGRFLDAIRGARGKVIMTSRSREEWLTPQQRFEVRLGGLDREERWEYCEKILSEIGLASKVNRDDSELRDLMEQLKGHPLAMRAVLPRLERMTATAVSKALKTNLAELGLNENEEQGRLFATLRFVEKGLPDELLPLLGLVGLHESYVSARLMELMAKQVDPTWTRARIDRLMAALGAAGLVRDVGNATYEMHPLLTSYLRSHCGVSESCQRAFVDVMVSVANFLVQRLLRGQGLPFIVHDVAIRHALDLSANLRMDRAFAGLTQALAAIAQETRDFAEASRLYQQLSRHCAAIGDSKWEGDAYHQLGVVAEEQRDFANAREWYLKSLAVEGRLKNEQGAAITYNQLGTIAQKQRDFAKAREWYLKSLAIEEQLGNQSGAAGSYHNLGTLELQLRDFATAREWYLKSLAIHEELENLDGAAATYQQMGRIAEEQDDYGTAGEWYLKSLAIRTQQGDEHGAMQIYHQLGWIAQQQGDLSAARDWYLKSLAINERQRNEYAAAKNYLHLGGLAEQQKDFVTAREWFLKSLAINERHGDEHGAARARARLGQLAGLQGNMEESGRLLTSSIRFFLEAGDDYRAEGVMKILAVFFLRSSPEDKQRLRTMWKEANLGPFPDETSEGASG